MVCSRCSRSDVEAHKHNPHLCDECVKAEDSRVSFLRQQNVNWMDVAKEAELEIWERQPGETDHDWSTWLAYRDAYPFKKPTYKEAAQTVGTSVSAVQKIATRWAFPARMQSWARYCDNLMLKKREKEILEMNERHVVMARKLNAKLELAIDNLQPMEIGPKQLAGLAKMATDLERKARLDSTPTGSAELDGQNDALKKTGAPKTDDMLEILQVLGKAGLLNATALGIRQTTTTEIVVKE